MEGQDPNEMKVYEKLQQLNSAMHAPVEKHQALAATVDNDPSQMPAVNSADIDRLERMMEATQNGGEEDPELGQLSQMMDKILAIQHPEQVRERARKASLQQKEAVFPVQVQGPALSISLLGSDTLKTGVEGNSAQFYGLEDEQQQGSKLASVLASVHGTQTLSSGSVVKLRLEQDIYVGGELIEKGSFIYGTSEINRERMLITVTALRSGLAILPVKMKVFDLDAHEGIYIPGSVQREVAKTSTDNALQGLELSNLDPTLKAQAASAGITAAKSLLPGR